MAVTGIDGKVRRSGTVRERNERVVRLKEELNLILQLVVHSREALSNELNSEFAQKKLSIDDKFLRKLKELTVCYNSLTESRIRLDKSERTLEKELTPAEEVQTVREFIRALEKVERREFLKVEVEAYKRSYEPE